MIESSTAEGTENTWMIITDVMDVYKYDLTIKMVAYESTRAQRKNFHQKESCEQPLL